MPEPKEQNEPKQPDLDNSAAMKVLVGLDELAYEIHARRPVTQIVTEWTDGIVTGMEIHARYVIPRRRKGTPKK